MMHLSEGAVELDFRLDLAATSVGRLGLALEHEKNRRSPGPQLALLALVLLLGEPRGALSASDGPSM